MRLIRGRGSYIFSLAVYTAGLFLNMIKGIFIWKKENFILSKIRIMKSFLIVDCLENMIEHNTVDVKINDKLAKELNALARKVIRLHERGIRITLSDLQKILDGLKE